MSLDPDDLELQQQHKSPGAPSALALNALRSKRLQLRLLKSKRLCTMASTSAAQADKDLQTTFDPHQPCASYGLVSLCGRRREMEDYLRVETGPMYDFFAVYDGHGGAKVAEVCNSRLFKILEEVIGDVGDVTGLDWEKALCDAFAKMDDEIVASGLSVEDGVNGDGVVAVGPGGGVERNGGVVVGAAAGERNGDRSTIKSVGSTAVVAVVAGGKIVVANCGDSRAVLSRRGVAIPLSSDHKPDRHDEMERVESAGGRVVDWNGYRILGVLATSRSFGDYYLKPYVISEPEVTVTERSGTDEFLVLASDGLWDVMSNEFACEIARRCLYGGGIAGRFRLQQTGRGHGLAAETAAVLAELALAKGSTDNISVIVVNLKK